MKILKFSTSHCGQCMVVTERMRKAGVKFTEVDCEKQPEVVERYGIKAVPQVVVVDEQGNEKTRYKNMPEIMKAVSIGVFKNL